MNIFLNAYQQPENKLTYNFLAVLEYLNDKTLLQFLMDSPTKDSPVSDIRTVYGGGETNPDGSFRVKLETDKTIKVLYENKTNRRGLSPEQIVGHLKQCEENDKVLITSPRKSDIEVIRELNDKRVVFKTWQEISLFLKTNYPQNIIAMQFVEYGKKSGEFDELGEIYTEDIKIYYEYLKTNFDRKIESIFRNFLHDFDFKKFGFTNFKRCYGDRWGRKGIEFEKASVSNLSYDQFGAISLYYDTEDHGIMLQNNISEIAFFFDVIPTFKESLQKDSSFVDLVERLVFYGFESNLNNEISPNKWRLLVYRKPLTEFKILNVQELILFTENALSVLQKEQAHKHQYFKEFLE